MSQPRVLDHPLYRRLRHADISDFNAQKPQDGSLVRTKISGGYFRRESSPDAILMSFNLAVRLRYHTHP